MSGNTSSNLLHAKLACPSPDCDSSDAYHIYDDHAFCFSCRKYFPPEEVPELKDSLPPKREEEEEENVADFNLAKDLKEIQDYECREFEERKVRKEVCKFYEIRIERGPDKEIVAHYYPYYHRESGVLTGYQKRKLPKDFKTIGKRKSLFGSQLFTKGGKRIVITEGEIDCLTVAQSVEEHYNTYFPVVAIPGVNSDKIIAENREFLRSFDEVVLCYDQDEVGMKAARNHARKIGVDKCKIAKLPEKDPNAVYLTHGGRTILKAIWNAEPWSPAGIMSKDDLREELLNHNEKESVPYPSCIGQLNSKFKGRRLGEITLWASGTGSGKSTILREVILHTRETTEDKIGILALEERPGETAKHLCAVWLSRNPSLEDIPSAEILPAFEYLFDNDRIIVLNHHESEGSLLEIMEEMALMGCKWIILDHLTLLASESYEAGSENAQVDAIMNRMRRLVKQEDVHVDVISQLRKTGTEGASFEEGKMPSLDDIKGSGAIKQCSFNVIGFARNLNAEDELERNTIKLASLKCRHSGQTGPLADAYYSTKTNRICREPPVEYEKDPFTRMNGAEVSNKKENTFLEDM